MSTAPLVRTKLGLRRGRLDPGIKEGVARQTERTKEVAVPETICRASSRL